MFRPKCEADFGRMERVEGGDLEIWRRISLKYFRERPFSAVFCYAFLIIVTIYGISVIFGTEDKPVHNYDGEIDQKIKAFGLLLRELPLKILLQFRSTVVTLWCWAESGGANKHNFNIL